MKRETEHEQLENAWLDRARRGMEPSAGDAARVLAKTKLAIAAAGTSAVASGVAWHASAWTKLALVAALTGSSALLGYRAGFEAGAAAAPNPSVATSVATQDAAGAPYVVRDAEASSKAPLRSDSAEATVIAANELRTEHVATDRVATRTSRPQRNARDTSTEAPNVMGPALEPPEDPSLDASVAELGAPASLERETRALREIERALRANEPQRALSLITTLDREQPNGKLGEERFAATVMARCALGLGSSMGQVLAFSQRYPASMYFARVRATCVAKEHTTAK